MALSPLSSDVVIAASTTAPVTAVGASDGEIAGICGAPNRQDSMPTATGILGLAAELHVNIAERLDNAGLLSFRQACRVLEKNSVDAFAERFFTMRRHIVTVESLQVLRDILAKPTFARHIQEVEFVVVTLPGQGPKKWPRLSRQLQAKVQAANAVHIASQEAATEGVLALLPEIVKNLDDLQLSPTFRINSNLDWRKNLNTPLLDFSGEEDIEQGWEPWLWFRHLHGLKSYCKKEHIKTLLWASSTGLEGGNINHFVRKFLVVLGDHPKLVKRLDIGISHANRWSISPDSFEPIPGTQLLKMCSVWSNLTTLRLGLKRSSNWPHNIHQDILKLLAATQNLTSLEILTVDGDLQYKIFTEVAHLKLRHIGIGQARLSADELHDMLDAYKNTLEDLRLDNVLVDGPEDDCYQILSWIGREVQLKHIYVQGMQTTDAPRRDNYIAMLQHQEGQDWFEFESDENQTVSDQLEDVGSWARFEEL